MGYIFLIVAPIAIALLLLCLRYPSIGVQFVRPYPRTYGERIAVLIPWVVFWGVLAADAFLPITAQFPFVMFVPPALPTLTRLSNSGSPLDIWRWSAVPGW
jgi:hypothetical protein